MRTFVFFLLISLLVGLGLTFLIFAEKSPEIDRVREQYAEVFMKFERNAEEISTQYGVAGLEVLQKYQGEGLRILKQYGNGFQMLQPYLEVEIIVPLFVDYGPEFEDLIETFQPAVIAQFYRQFGRDGLRYIIDDPNNYFLILQYGERVVQLANVKGPIVFTLVRKDQPEFIEVYYDDVLFEIISRFGVEGLLTLRTYRGMATMVFDLFGDDERFGQVLRMYGYQQVIPLLYYFYQTKNTTELFTERIMNFGLHRLFQQQLDELEAPDEADRITLEHARVDRARWALQRIYESGNTFLRQFAITPDGKVQPLRIMVITNFFEDVLLGELRDDSSSQSTNVSQTSSLNGEARCDRLKAALGVLGLLPYETLISKQVRCFYLQAGLPEVNSLEEIEGLLALDDHEELVTRYGEAVVPFVTQYGREGIQLLQQTDGEILQLSAVHGEELVLYAVQYGTEVFDLIRKYGDQMLEAIKQTDGAIIPYIKKYGQEMFPILAQPEGVELVALCPVFGEEILKYAARYPGDFFDYLLKYGSLCVKAFQSYDMTTMNLVRKYGDWIIPYLGLYGDKALRIASTGQAGILFLPVLPEEFWQNEGERFSHYSYPRQCLTLFIQHPEKFHEYIGLLGERLFSVKPRYIQLSFWTLLVLILLYVVWIVYRMLERVSRGEG